MKVDKLLRVGSGGAKSERADLIGQFVSKINTERLDTKWKPVTARAIAIKVGHIKNIQELYYFYGMCNRYKGEFGKAFFGSLKTDEKKENNI